MNVTKLLLPVSLMLLPAIGCGPSVPPPPPRTQLEIRQNQTREYPTDDAKLVMKALLNTLQDDGFIVRNAVTELGLITATKELEVERIGSSFGGPIFSGGFGSGSRGSGFGVGLGSIFGPGGGSNWGGGDDRYSQNSIIEASANVTALGKQTRVRVNFQKKTVDNRGGTIEVLSIEEPSYYQTFFSKVDKGIFLQKERL